MRRHAPPALLVGVLLFACGASNGDNGVDAPDQMMSGAVCGDGICAPSELLTCQVDCGPEGRGSGSGSDGSGSDGSGSGTMGGSGSGSADFCHEKTVEEECFLCLGANICQGSGISIGSCLACAFSG